MFDGLVGQGGEAFLHRSKPRNLGNDIGALQDLPGLLGRVKFFEIQLFYCFKDFLRPYLLWMEMWSDPIILTGL
jgi:hypothetical protein